MPLAIAALAFIGLIALSIRRTLTTAPTARAIIDGIPFYGEGGNGRFFVYPNMTLLPTVATEYDRAYTRAESHYWIRIGNHWADDIQGQRLAERAIEYG